MDVLTMQLLEIAMGKTAYSLATQGLPEHAQHVKGTLTIAPKSTKEDIILYLLV